MADKKDKKGFLLRVPAPLLDDLRRWAAQDMRSLNGHIEWLLREALRRRGRTGRPEGAEGGAPPRRSGPRT